MIEPSGQEHRRPLRLRDTSATERASFRKCRRQWLLTVANRLGNVEGNANFLFGTAVHAGLAAFYGAQKARKAASAQDAAIEGYRGVWDASMETLRGELGFLWPQYAPAYAETRDMGDAMILGYIEQEARTPLGEPVSIEERFEVPILGPGGHTVGILSVQLDIVVDREGRRKIVDHKTAASAPNVGQLDMDDQLTAYIWARWKATGEWVSEADYNVLLKKLPHPPRLLKSGKLSVDKSQVTTYDMFAAEIDRLGLSRNDYAEHLAWLQDEGPRLFIREGVFRVRGQMRSFEENLYHEWIDMKRVALRPETAYPNPSPFNCPSCPVKLVCTTMMDGGDVETIIRDNFMLLPPRR